MQAGSAFAFGGAQVEVLAPPPDYLAPNTPRNNDSLVMRVAFGRNTFLLTGDVERQVEAQLSAEGHLAHVDVLKVPHHGSKTSSTADFLDLVRPEFAIISDGFGNSYGHPHPDVLARLADRGAAVLRTDRDGRVSIRSDGRRLYVDTRGQEASAAPGLYGLFF
jgi:competence protein ComEC